MADVNKVTRDGSRSRHGWAYEMGTPTLALPAFKIAV